MIGESQLLIILQVQLSVFAPSARHIFLTQTNITIGCSNSVSLLWASVIWVTKYEANDNKLLQPA